MRSVSSLDGLSAELVRKAARSVPPGIDACHCDFFVFGAIRRILSQSAGFAKLIEARNFPSAAGILRMQLDTAMRLNGLTIVPSRDALARGVVFEGRRFNTYKDRDGKKLSLAVERPCGGGDFSRRRSASAASGRAF